MIMTSSCSLRKQGVPEERQYKSKNIEIVIARYNEDLNWLENPIFYPIDNITVYNKGQNDNFMKNIRRTIDLPNLGRESHTYLTHIIRNYDSLADMTIFLPGSAETPHKWSKVQTIMEMLKETEEHAFPEINADIYGEELDFHLDAWGCNHTMNQEMHPSTELTPSKYRPFREWYAHYFGMHTYGTYTKCGYTGVFAINKKHILKRPKSYYMNLIQDLEVSSNPEVGHYFERAWSAVFDII